MHSELCAQKMFTISFSQFLCPSLFHTLYLSTNGRASESSPVRFRKPPCSSFRLFFWVCNVEAVLFCPQDIPTLAVQFPFLGVVDVKFGSPSSFPRFSPVSRFGSRRLFPAPTFQRGRVFGCDFGDKSNDQNLLFFQIFPRKKQGERACALRRVSRAAQTFRWGHVCMGTG